MNISGILVQASPDRVPDVSAVLSGMPGVEVHQQTDDGKLIVTIEDDNPRESGDSFVKINMIDGVLAASLVYHHYEPEDASNADTPSVGH